MAEVPSGANADYYQNGRGQALYRGQQVAANPPPQGTPAWWVNEGVKDVWAGQPSRTGVETVYYDAEGRPMPVVSRGQVVVMSGGAGTRRLSPGGPRVLPANSSQPPVQPVTLPIWADDYWAAYLWSLQDPVTARMRAADSNFSPAYRKGATDGLNRAPFADPQGLSPSDDQLLQTGLFIVGAQAQGPAPGMPPIIRPAPPAPPRVNPGDGVFVPPPGPVTITYELYGTMRGRTVPLDSILIYSRSGYRARPGGRIMVGTSAGQGYGLGGRPGAWSRIYPDPIRGSPSNFGLDGDKGVVKWDEHSRRGYAIAAGTLAEIFGPAWRTQVYV